MLRTTIIAATAAILVAGTGAALAKSAGHHRADPGYGYSYVPSDGYGPAYRSAPADRHDPTDTNGF